MDMVDDDSLSFDLDVFIFRVVLEVVVVLEVDDDELFFFSLFFEEEGAVLVAVALVVLGEDFFPEVKTEEDVVDVDLGVLLVALFAVVVLLVLVDPELDSFLVEGLMVNVVFDVLTSAAALLVVVVSISIGVDPEFLSSEEEDILEGLLILMVVLDFSVVAVAAEEAEAEADTAPVAGEGTSSVELDPGVSFVSSVLGVFSLVGVAEDIL